MNKKTDEKKDCYNVKSVFVGDKPANNVYKDFVIRNLTKRERLNGVSILQKNAKKTPGV